MSYDVSIGNESFNYTWSMTQFFRDHIEGNENGGGLNELMDKTGAEAFIILRGAIDNIHTTYLTLGKDEICRRYDSSNGWGSVIGAIIFISQVMAACAANSDEKVLVS